MPLDCIVNITSIIHQCEVVLGSIKCVFKSVNV
jgi:hypothetical protein